MTEGPPDVEALIAAGSYPQAAAILRDRGELARAQALLEKVWDFAGAAELARARGDRPACLRLLLDAKDPPGAARVIEALHRDGTPAELGAAAEVCEHRRMAGEAARLRERAGELPRASELYREAGLLHELGRLEEQLGRLREAGLSYERFLLADPASPDAPAVERSLGRVLGRLGRHEEAVRHLQRGLRGGRTDDPTLDPAREDLVAELAALGLDDAARAVLAPLAARRPSLAADASSPTGEAGAGGDLRRLLASRARAVTDDDGLLAGRYRVIRLLGSGGMGRVYLALDRVTEQEVAVKMVAAPVDERAREAYARFLREARAMAALRHPNLVTVREVHAEAGLLVMDYQPGGTLADRLRVGLAPRAVQRALLQVLRGLQAAHARGLVHRDVKPANVFFGGDGEARLGDFGVAHLQDLGATQTGGFIGTLAYMSPEQITGAPLTFACDVYALGVTAFQALTGRLPFPGPDLVGAHLGTPPPAPSSLAPALGTGFDALVLRALAKDPAARHGSLDELARELAAIACEAPGEAPPSVEPEPEPAEPARAPDRYRLEERLRATELGTLFRATDERLGRAVVVERFAPDALTGAPGEARLRWLRAMARHGGPHLQRVLRIEPRDDGVHAVYEEVRGAPFDGSRRLDRTLAARLLLDGLSALAGLHREQIAHGALEAALVIEDWGATITVAGLAAAAGDATPDRDLLALADAVARGAGDAVDDLPRAAGAAALAAWARAALGQA